MSIVLLSTVGSYYAVTSLSVNQSGVVGLAQAQCR
jgi:hypothetical protein